MTHESRWWTCASFDTETFCSAAPYRDLRGAPLWPGHLLPLFYQELLGYTAFAAGWAVSPRGIGAIIAMPDHWHPHCQARQSLADCCGFVMFAISSLRFGQADLAISQWSFLWAIILSGFGSGSVFVPLSAVAVAGLANEEIGNASGLYNLFAECGRQHRHFHREHHRRPAPAAAPERAGALAGAHAACRCKINCTRCRHICTPRVIARWNRCGRPMR